MESACKRKLEGNMRRQRRSANYKPNIWKYDFIQSLGSKYDGEECKKCFEKLREDVKQMFVNEKEQIEKLKLVDKMKKLGLAYLFEEEIEITFCNINAANSRNDNIIADDIYATALCFRLLREHGYQVSQDMLGRCLEEAGSHDDVDRADVIKGLVELLEASYLGFEGENTVAKIKECSTQKLKHYLSNRNNCMQKVDAAEGDGGLAELVAHVLELPSHQRVAWFNVKWNIHFYEQDKDIQIPLLQLAKLNFNIVQLNLQNDLKHISQWWKKLDLIHHLTFTRDRLVECFMCSVGLVFQPQYSSFRKWLTKLIILVLIIDDVYDLYGSEEELKQFTNAVDRWDFKEIQDLPECMLLCFQVLYDTVHETAYEIHKENRWDQVLTYLKIGWADFCKSLYVEAKWDKEGYTPSLKECLNNAWISSSGALIAIHSFLATTIPHDHPTQEIIEFLETKCHDLIYNQCLIIRLCNDLGTSMAEKERGDSPSSILCYQREKKVGEEEAEKEIKEIIKKSWQKMNGEWFAIKSSSPFLKSFVDVTVNAARVAHCLYQYEDGFGVQDHHTRRKILSFLVEPFMLH